MNPSPVVRRLDGISYWVIERPEEIAEYINTNIRKEWEADSQSQGKDPRKDEWLLTLDSREWSVLVVDTNKIKLNEDLLNYKDSTTGYDFRERLHHRGDELREEIKGYGRVIPPIILRAEDNGLMDGYCRHFTLMAMRVRRVYAYVGRI